MRIPLTGEFEFFKKPSDRRTTTVYLPNIELFTVPPVCGCFLNEAYNGIFGKRAAQKNCLNYCDKFYKV